MSSNARAKTVLICDDEVGLVAELADFLAASGWRSAIAHSYDEAVDVLLKGEAVNCLLTDRRMPGGSGEDLIDFALGMAQHMRPAVIALMTGVPELELAGKSCCEPGYLVIEKPFDPASVHELLATRLAALD